MDVSNPPSAVQSVRELLQVRACVCVCVSQCSCVYVCVGVCCGDNKVKMCACELVKEHGIWELLQACWVCVSTCV